jgi:hypothetical protein
MSNVAHPVAQRAALDPALLHTICELTRSAPSSFDKVGLGLRTPLTAGVTCYVSKEA